MKNYPTDVATTQVQSPTQLTLKPPSIFSVFLLTKIDARTKRADRPQNRSVKTGGWMQNPQIKLRIVQKRPFITAKKGVKSSFWTMENQSGQVKFLNYPD